MEMAILFFMISIMCLIGLIVSSKNQSMNMKSTYSKTDELKIQYEKVIALGYDKNILNYVGFNNKNNTITIKTKGLEEIISYNDINKVELLENNKLVMSVANIAMGGVVLGGAGVILGGMNKKEKIISKKIKFELNNFDNPSYEIDLLNVGKTIEYGIDINDSANKIMDTVKYIIENK